MPSFPCYFQAKIGNGSLELISEHSSIICVGLTFSGVKCMNGSKRHKMLLWESDFSSINEIFARFSAKFAKLAVDISKVVKSAIFVFVTKKLSSVQSC